MKRSFRSLAPALGSFAVIASFALAACPLPTPEDRALRCATVEPRCPSKYQCGSDDFCYSEDTDLSAVAADAGHDHGASDLSSDLTGVDADARLLECADFCECMKPHCTDAGKTPPFTDISTCVAYCKGLPATAEVVCRFNHCELARDTGLKDLHCGHALGSDPLICK
jgi:hypothetical protein